MKNVLTLSITALFGVSALAQPGITIYNGGFAVVRDAVTLELKAGENSVRYFGATSDLEPSSVTLRDPSGKVSIAIAEQNYNNAQLNQLALLDQYEGKSLPFLIRDPKGDRVVEGKVIRSGHVPGGQPVDPIIEVEGKLSFELPGRPLFPSLKDDTLLLKPQLSWKIHSTEPAAFQAELAYLTRGLNWNASYNLILPETGDTADLSAWVSIVNNSGKQFENARIKLMAGEVHRVNETQPVGRPQRALMKGFAMAAMEPEVTEKTFGDLHLYNVERPTTLRDQETKQIELMRASGIPLKRLYLFDSGANLFGRPQPVLDRDWQPDSSERRNVETSLEFFNSEASKLGTPLPSGVVRVYRRDGEQLEFVGEDRVAHTPRNETVRLRLGAAFDLSGTRKRLTFSVDQPKRVVEESFEVRLRNHSSKPVEVQVREHLLRAANWTVPSKTHEFRRTDNETIEFLVPVSPERETVIQYSVRYTW